MGRSSTLGLGLTPIPRSTGPKNAAGPGSSKLWRSETQVRPLRSAKEPSSLWTSSAAARRQRGYSVPGDLWFPAWGFQGFYGRLQAERHARLPQALKVASPAALPGWFLYLPTSRLKGPKALLATVGGHQCLLLYDLAYCSSYSCCWYYYCDYRRYYRYQYYHEYCYYSLFLLYNGKLSYCIAILCLPNFQIFCPFCGH